MKESSFLHQSVTTPKKKRKGKKLKILFLKSSKIKEVVTLMTDTKPPVASRASPTKPNSPQCMGEGEVNLTSTTPLCAADDAQLPPLVARVMNSFPSLRYPVVKKHHRMSWLKQNRLLVITGTHIMNCRVPSHPQDEPVATKSFHLNMLLYVGMKSNKSFMLRFQGGDPRLLLLLTERLRNLVGDSASHRRSAGK